MITIAFPSGQRAGPIAISEAEALLHTLMAISTEEGGNLQLDQLLQVVACQLGHPLHGRAAIE